MQTIIFHKKKEYQIDLSKPIDISIALQPTGKNVNAFHAPPFEAAPVISGKFTGSVKAGGPVNFFNVRINPHGNGTHTECVGHISSAPYTINQCLKKFFFLAELISIYPVTMENSDKVIMQEQLQKQIGQQRPDALVIRSLPNDNRKLTADYSGKNPPYLHADAAYYLQEIGVKHLLIDLPSVDREEDNGQLLAHKAFWQYPGKPREDATITELIYVPEEVDDGIYFLNIQIASFEIDVSPSKPVLYKVLQ